MLRANQHTICQRNVKAVRQLDYMPLTIVILDGEHERAQSSDGFAFSRFVTETFFTLPNRLELQVFKVIDVGRE